MRTRGAGFFSQLRYVHAEDFEPLIFQALRNLLDCVAALALLVDELGEAKGQLPRKEIR